MKEKDLEDEEAFGEGVGGWIDGLENKCLSGR